MKMEAWFRMAALAGMMGTTLTVAQDRSTLSTCEWCGADEAPDSLHWSTTIAGPNEPGVRLVVSGRVVEADGHTPAAGVILYVYHTNADGIYPKRGDERGNARRHGYLRSWLRTDAHGRYEFHTIKPAPYPGSTEPAHIHVTVKPPGRTEQWLDSYVFDDDPLLTQDRRRRMDLRGGDGILRTEKDSAGVLRARRNIVLPS